MWCWWAVMMMMLLLAVVMTLLWYDVGSQVNPLSHPLTMSDYHLLADPCLSSLLRDSNVFYEVSTYVRLIRSSVMSMEGCRCPCWLVMLTIMTMMIHNLLFRIKAHWWAYMYTHLQTIQIALNTPTLLQIFSSCLFHIDRTWIDTKATRTDFSRIVNELKAIVTAVLRRGPSSLKHFRGMASEEGMLSWS